MSTPENIRIAETFPLLSVVVPVYEEEANISPFLERLIPVMEKINSEYEVIFSMDHSTDGTEKTIVEHLERNPKIKLLRFSRRFGQPMATLAGLHYSSGEAVVVIDVDLQDPPELIEEMVEKWPNKNTFNKLFSVFHKVNILKNFLTISYPRVF